MTSHVNNVVGSDGHVPLKTNVNFVINFDPNYNGPAVYQLNPSGTDKEYIGATVNLKRRLYEHKLSLKKGNHVNHKLQAIVETVKEVIVTVFPLVDSNMAFQIEKEHISEKKGSDNFLNIQDGSFPPMNGKNHSEETKNKIRQHHREMYNNGYVNPFKGKTHTPEYKERSSRRTKEQWSTPEYKLYLSKRMIDHFADSSKRDAVRDQVKKLWEDPEYREHQIQKRIEVANQPDVIEKNRQRTTSRMTDPSNREISRQAAIQQWNDPVKREILTKARVEQWKDPVFREQAVRIRQKPVEINGVQYDSMKAAQSALGLSTYMFYKITGKKASK